MSYRIIADSRSGIKICIHEKIPAQSISGNTNDPMPALTLWPQLLSSQGVCDHKIHCAIAYVDTTFRSASDAVLVRGSECLSA